MFMPATGVSKLLGIAVVTGRERFGGANNFSVARLKLWLIPQEGNLDRISELQDFTQSERESPQLLKTAFLSSN